MKRVKLFCVPYAGGSAVTFNKWKYYLHPAVELRPIELAGRGIRIHERPYKNVGEAIDDVFNIIASEIRESEFALYGHSLGSKIAYGVAQKLKDNNASYLPDHLFFSGGGAPHVIRADRKKFHLMKDEEFKREVMGLGGTPPEVFEHPELLELFLPLLRNDFKLAEEEPRSTDVDPFETNITVLLGKEDDLTLEQCEGWRVHTKRQCTIHYFDGGHFFLHNESEHIARLINDTLLNVRVAS